MTEYPAPRTEPRSAAPQPCLSAAGGGRPTVAASGGICLRNMAGGDMTLFIYGEVSDSGEAGAVTSREVVEQLTWADASPEVRSIRLRLNSIGGEVYAGFAIFQAIRSLHKPVVVQVDGLAASIAGIIAMAAPRVEMGKYARLMIHSVSGGGFGNKTELRKLIAEIESLESSIADILAGRLGMEAAEVAATYFDGTDHWFTAQQALDAGLADAIYDEEPVPDGMGHRELYNLFTNRLESLRPQNPTEMTTEELKQKHPRFQDCATVEDVAEAAAEIAAENERLQAENGRLEAEAQSRREEQIGETLDAAVRDGRITEEQRPLYQNLLRSDFANASAALGAMKPRSVRRVADDIATAKTLPQNAASAWGRKMDEIQSRRQGLK